MPIKIFGFVRDFVESVNVVKINSKSQKIVNFNKVILEGEVEILVDTKIHMWADIIEIDKEKQTLVAQKVGCGSVVVENRDFLILADKFFLDLDKKTGYADNFRIHFIEGYIKASKAEKVNEKNWKMEDMLYTPCDAANPHWSITAAKATLYGSYFVRVTDVLFKMRKIPFFIVPIMALPIQNRSKSGFLLPKFSYDDYLGFGIRQEFYWSIFPRCDSTIGVDWRDRLGIAFLDEFRWARSTESFTFINVNYALEKNAYVKKRNKILQETEKHYWINGKDFRSFYHDYLPTKTVNSLLRMDFGTDKRIGYKFFDAPQSVSDTFYNSWILRTQNLNNIINFVLDGNKTSRSQFSPVSGAELKSILKTLPSDFTKEQERKGFFSKTKEIEDKVEVYKIPHLEWNTVYRNLKKILFYRHDIFLDQIFSRKSKTERIYIDSRVAKEKDILGLIKAETMRFLYTADLYTSLSFKDQILKLYIKPNLQAVNNLKDPDVRARTNVIERGLFSRGVYRLFLQGGAEWSFPEALFYNYEKNYFYYFQPTLSWNFLPKFKQDHWYHSDLWDRYYPKNEINFNARNNWYFDDIQIDLNISQSYDFYSNSDIFLLRRAPKQNNLLPAKINFGIGSDILNFGIAQEYSCKTLELLQSEMNFNFSSGQFNIYLSTLYQSRSLQQVRELYSDIPNFVLFGFSVPLIGKTSLHYDGQFYSHKDSKVFPFEGLKPLYHGIKLEIEGHCWGISVGFEEKMYKEYGNWKSDRAFTLFIRLESLGSFTRKFKRPTINNNM